LVRVSEDVLSQAHRPQRRFDEDVKTDIALYRVNTGAWFYIPSSTNTPVGVGFGGDPSDIPVPGDYDGDGKTDFAVYRLTTGAWFIYPSKTEVAYGSDSEEILQTNPFLGITMEME